MLKYDLAFVRLGLHRFSDSLYLITVLSLCSFQLNLFIWLCRISDASCRIFFAPCRSFLAARGVSLVARAPVVAVHQLSYPAACGILVPQPGIEPVSSALQGRFLTPGPLGKSCATSLYEVSKGLTLGYRAGREPCKHCKCCDSAWVSSTATYLNTVMTTP